MIKNKRKRHSWQKQCSVSSSQRQRKIDNIIITSSSLHTLIDDNKMKTSFNKNNLATIQTK